MEVHNDNILDEYFNEGYVHRDNIDNVDGKQRNLNDLLKQGSEFLLDLNFESAIPVYEYALRLLNYCTEEYDLNVNDVCAIEYALCLCYITQDSYYNKAKEEFSPLVISYGKQFPTLYYAQAILLLQQHLFEETKKCINDGLDALLNITIKNSFRTNWPGTTILIPESDTDTLYKSLQNLRKYCNKQSTISINGSLSILIMHSIPTSKNSIPEVSEIDLLDVMFDSRRLNNQNLMANETGMYAELLGYGESYANQIGMTSELLYHRETDTHTSTVDKIGISEMLDYGNKNSSTLIDLKENPLFLAKENVKHPKREINGLYVSTEPSTIVTHSEYFGKTESADDASVYIKSTLKADVPEFIPKKFNVIPCDQNKCSQHVQTDLTVPIEEAHIEIDKYDVSYSVQKSLECVAYEQNKNNICSQSVQTDQTVPVDRVTQTDIIESSEQCIQVKSETSTVSTQSLKWEKEICQKCSLTEKDALNNIKRMENENKILHKKVADLTEKLEVNRKQFEEEQETRQNLAQIISISSIKFEMELQETLKTVENKKKSLNSAFMVHYIRTNDIQKSVLNKYLERCKLMIYNLKQVSGLLTNISIPTIEDCNHHIELWDIELKQTQSCLKSLQKYQEQILTEFQNGNSSVVPEPPEFSLTDDEPKNILQENFHLAVLKLVNDLKHLETIKKFYDDYYKWWTEYGRYMYNQSGPPFVAPPMTSPTTGPQHQPPFYQYPAHYAQGPVLVSKQPLAVMPSTQGLLTNSNIHTVNVSKNSNVIKDTVISNDIRNHTTKDHVICDDIHNHTTKDPVISDDVCNNQTNLDAIASNQHQDSEATVPDINKEGSNNPVEIAKSHSASLLEPNFVKVRNTLEKEGDNDDKKVEMNLNNDDTGKYSVKPDGKRSLRIKFTRKPSKLINNTDATTKFNNDILKHIDDVEETPPNSDELNAVSDAVVINEDVPAPDSKPESPTLVDLERIDSAVESTTNSEETHNDIPKNVPTDWWSNESQNIAKTSDSIQNKHKTTSTNGVIQNTTFISTSSAKLSSTSDNDDLINLNQLLKKEDEAGCSLKALGGPKFYSLFCYVKSKIPNMSDTDIWNALSTVKQKRVKLSGMTKDNIVKAVQVELISSLEINKNGDCKAAWTKINTEPVKWAPDQQDNICVICIESFERMSVTSLKCDHTFHTDCIRKWFSTNCVCPVCRIHATFDEDFPPLRS